MFEYIVFVQACRGVRFTRSIGMNISDGMYECVRTFCNVLMACLVTGGIYI